MHLMMISWLLIGLLSLFLNDRSNYRCSTILIIVNPRSSRMFIPFSFLSSVNFYPFWWCLWQSYLVLVYFQSLESLWVHDLFQEFLITKFFVCIWYTSFLFACTIKSTTFWIETDNRTLFNLICFAVKWLFIAILSILLLLCFLIT